MRFLKLNALSRRDDGTRPFYVRDSHIQSFFQHEAEEAEVGDEVEVIPPHTALETTGCTGGQWMIVESVDQVLSLLTDEVQVVSSGEEVPPFIVLTVIFKSGLPTEARHVMRTEAICCFAWEEERTIRHPLLGARHVPANTRVETASADSGGWMVRETPEEILKLMGCDLAFHETVNQEAV